MTVVEQTSPCTTSAEEETLSRIYPFRCYSDHMSKSQDFKSMDEMCTTLGVKAEEVEYALQHYEGVMGAFVFKDRRRWELAQIA